MSDFRIPKKAKVDNQTAVTSAEKRKHSSDEDTHSDEEIAGDQPHFKKKVVRVSRVSGVGEKTSATSSRSNPSNFRSSLKQNHDKDSAVPLGRQSDRSARPSNPKFSKRDHHAERIRNSEAPAQPDTSTPTPDEAAMVAKLAQNIQNDQPQLIDPSTFDSVVPEPGNNFLLMFSFPKFRLYYIHIFQYSR